MTGLRVFVSCTVTPLNQMKNEPIISDHLLITYVKGEASAQETQIVEDWLAESVDNRNELGKIKLLWKGSEAIADFEAIDMAKNWKELQSRISQAPEKSTVKWHVWKYAAALLLLAAVTFLIIRPGEELVMQNALASEGPIELSLADGSKVWLNKGASLDYPEKFIGSKREVTLKGEAFFEVTHNPEKPFIVTADGTTTEVLGTSFNIYEGEGELFQLVLKTGKVRFTKDRKRATLLPGDKISVNARGEIMKTANTDRNFMSWKTRKLVFENTPMEEVIGDISRLYGVVLEITDKEFLSCPLNATFNNEPLEEVMGTIELLFNVEARQNGQLYQLIGKGCNK